MSWYADTRPSDIRIGLPMLLIYMATADDINDPSRAVRAWHQWWWAKRYDWLFHNKKLASASSAPDLWHSQYVPTEMPDNYAIRVRR
jgi:hypothetical protein